MVEGMADIHCRKFECHLWADHLLPHCSYVSRQLLISSRPQPNGFAPIDPPSDVICSSCYVAVPVVILPGISDCIGARPPMRGCLTHQERIILDLG